MEVDGVGEDHGGVVVLVDGVIRVGVDMDIQVWVGVDMDIQVWVGVGWVILALAMEDLVWVLVLILV
uniref:Transmembrane protein n=1 Tax=Rhabditophanes sp. KR3021 TaxID=114890 RepID=A0AC35U9J4_9BILA